MDCDPGVGGHGAVGVAHRPRQVARLAVVAVAGELAADPAEPGVVYAATGFWVGSSQMHFAPGSVFISVDSGSRWQTMPGPNGQPLQLTARVTALIPAVDTPLSVRAVTDQGMLSLTLDDAEALLSQLAEGDPAAQAWAALGLGILGVQGHSNSLLQLTSPAAVSIL